MQNMKKTYLYISLLFLIILVSGCGESKEAEIKKSFNKTLSMYPTENLEDFYDKEGFRDGEFDKGDKGTWIVHSEMTIEPKGKNMESRGMVLRINRNTRTTKGYFLISEITEAKKGYAHNKDKKYPVKMEHNQIIPTKPIPNDKLKKEIKNFKFFVQYANFKDINNYKNGDISYNPNVPSYSAKYQLSNNDYNVKQLRKRYDIPTKQAPKLSLKGDGDLKGSSLGHRELEFTFVENKQENIFYTNSLNFKPSK
ncbi:tandem-type lipoprotein [Staphylococcus caprae]|uniref:tandem-type lipoprotein n=1 Tax=Staphylococcus caprae TaxID=29380 RepID=UPI003B21FBFE